MVFKDGAYPTIRLPQRVVGTNYAKITLTQAQTLSTPTIKVVKSGGSRPPPLFSTVFLPGNKQKVVEVVKKPIKGLNVGGVVTIPGEIFLF